MTTNAADDRKEILKPAYFYYESTRTSRELHFYLSDGIEEPDKYVDMIHRIRTAGAEDIVYIHLNSPGGHLNTGVQLINAMQSSAARIVTSLEAISHSLGTLIFLAGDEFIVHDNCIMMFHNYSGGTFGKGNEQTAQLEATVKWFSTLARKIYVPFMSEEEFDRILRGEDLWMQSDEIRKRLDKMVKILTEKAAKESKKKTSKK